MEAVISQIDVMFVRPKRGLVGFASFVYRDEFYFSNISVFTRLTPNGKPAYRLAYPEDPNRKTAFFHPIKDNIREGIERQISAYVEERLAAFQKRGGGHGG